MAPLEIERKFLLPPCSIRRFLKKHRISFDAERIEQFYLRADREGVERCRQIGKRYIRTIKRGEGMIREEEEFPITKAEYRRCKKEASGGIIKKIRYRVSVEGLVYELDAFRGKLKGLNLLEVEFTDEEAALSFRPAAPFDRLVLREVTRRREFSNGAIARSMRIPALSGCLSALIRKAARENDPLASSLRAPLDPAMETAQAVRVLIYLLTRSIEANRRRILAGDGDAERLHRLRVSMRRLRALYSLMARAFEPRWLMRRKERMKALMEATAAVRDLDVGIERFDRYRELFPEHGDRLSRLADELKRRREIARVEMRKTLQSAETVSELTLLARFGLGETTGIGSANEPVISTLRPVLSERFAGLLSYGERLGSSAPPTAYHRQRIRVKKLRYLLELFETVYDPEAYSRALKALKGLQTLLGEHQDLQVECERLDRLQRRYAADDEEMARLVRDLQKRLHKQQSLIRRRYHRIFGKFKRKKGLFRRLICRD